jgi:muramoyltetrapeptide carboxypeptidase
MKPSEIKLPPYLKRGDSVGIVAPARKISREEIEPAAAILREWGLNVVLGQNLFDACDQFSGTDEARASDFQEMLDNPQIRAVICARGGYGSLRVIDKLDFTRFLFQPKWLVGYSDVTVFHNHIHTQLNMATIHATMPINFLKDAESTDSLRRALFGEELIYTVTNQTMLPNRAGIAEGQLVGGNLSLLYALQGSRSDIDTRGKILFIEDLDEYLYHVDRMMLSLKRTWKLSDLKGLIVGGMSDMKDNTIPFGKRAEEIIWDAVKQYDYPVCFGFPAGHETRNLALRFGEVVRLGVGEETVFASGTITSTPQT